MSNENEAILLEKRGKIAYITFNRPEVLNAFRPIDYYLLDDLVNDCDNDPEIRAIIFTGKGRAWSVGDDVSVAVSGEQHEEWVGQDPVQDLMWKGKNLELAMSRQLIATQKTCLTLLNSGKVSIAAVNGICYIAEYLYGLCGRCRARDVRPGRYQDRYLSHWIVDATGPPGARPPSCHGAAVEPGTDSRSGSLSPRSGQ